MNTLERELTPTFTRGSDSVIPGKRTVHKVSLRPQTAGPGTRLTIDVPRLDQLSSLVPGSLHLGFDMDVSGTKTHFKNNLSKLLQKKLQIRVAGKTVYDCDGEYIYSVYKDLWRTKGEREDMIRYGVANTNTRKLMSGEDSGASAGDTAKVSDGLMYKVFGNRVRMDISHIMKDHGLYAPSEMANNFEYVLILPNAEDILIKANGQVLGTYELNNISLEYETIEDIDVVRDSISSYADRTLVYEHLIHKEDIVVSAATTKMNIDINTPRDNIRGVVCIFKEDVNDEKDDSESFIFPNIEKVKVSIAGKPSRVYSDGITKNDLFDEAKRFFSPHGSMDRYITVRDFYKDKFALVIDLRSSPEIGVTGNGEDLASGQAISLDIEKKAYTSNTTCSVFVVSDGFIDYTNGGVTAVQ